MVQTLANQRHADRDVIFCTPHNQGRTEVRWRPGQGRRLAPPCSNLTSYGSKCTVLRKVLRPCWDFSAPLSHSAPGALCPLDPLVTPLRTTPFCYYLESFLQI